MYVKKLLFLPILFAQTIFYAAVNDPIPTDYEAVPVGKTVMSVNYLTKELHSKAFGSDDNYIKQSTYVLRYTHGFNLGGKTIGLGFAIPYTYLETQGKRFVQKCYRRQNKWLKRHRNECDLLAY